MTTPIVTELPVALEHVAHDPFIDGLDTVPSVARPEPQSPSPGPSAGHAVVEPAPDRVR